MMLFWLGGTTAAFVAVNLSKLKMLSGAKPEKASSIGGVQCL
jgi:hypothetical protein